MFLFIVHICFFGIVIVHIRIKKFCIFSFIKGLFPTILVFYVHIIYQVPKEKNSRLF